LHYAVSNVFFFPRCNSPSEPGPRYRGFTITLRHTTLGRTLLNEWSARRRDLYLTTHKTHKNQTFMTSAGFEPVIPKKQATADPRLRPRGHQDRHLMSSLR
jgi:hypothetical protein